MTRLGGHVTIFSQVSRTDAWRVQSQLGPWSMEVPQGQFVPFSCGSNRGIANHKYAVRRALLKHAFPLPIKQSSCERATYLLRYIRSHSVGVTYVWRIVVATNVRQCF